jgi:hypothetical protein
MYTKQLFAELFPKHCRDYGCPINAVIQYSHRFSTIPLDNKDGANARVGFIEADMIPERIPPSQQSSYNQTAKSLRALVCV